MYKAMYMMMHYDDPWSVSFSEHAKSFKVT